MVQLSAFLLLPIMQRLKFFLAVSSCSLIIAVFVRSVFAGDLSPSASPASTMHSLEEIWDKLVGSEESTSVTADRDGDVLERLEYVIENGAGSVAYGDDSAAKVLTTASIAGTYDASNITASNVRSGVTFGPAGTGTGTFSGNLSYGSDDANEVLTTADTPGTYDASNLTVGTVKSGTAFGVSSTGDYPSATYPLVGDTAATDAAAGDILNGLEAWTKAGVLITGTIQTQTLSSSTGTVAAGYYNATTLDAVDSDLASGNIKTNVQVFGITGSYVGYPGTGWQANGSGDGSTALNKANCDSAANWYWFEDGNGDGDTTDPEDGICVQGTHQAAAGSWNGDDYSTERDNTYIAAYTCSGNFPNGTVATYSGTDSSGNADTTWNDGDCALCQADCYDGKKDLPDQGGYTTPNEDISGHHGPITPEVLKLWKGTRLPTSNDFFGFCGYKDGYTAGDNYSTSCSSDTTVGNYGQLVGRTDECVDLSNSGAWEWLSEQHYYNGARVAGGAACSYFYYGSVNSDGRFRAVFRP